MPTNPVIENILSRRSVRSFTKQEISNEDISIILQAAIHAPSANNRQLWRFTVQRDKVFLKKLAEQIAAERDMSDPYDFYSPDTLILVSAPKDYAFALQDCSCAIQNIFLAASSLGIGSVWINQLLGICDKKLIRALLDEMDMPADHDVIACAALGYAAEKISQKTDKRTDVICFAK